MVSLLERLFGKKEPEVFSISLGAVPAWLDDRERAARSVLAEETGETQRIIKEAVLNLRRITQSVAEAEQDEKIHPKLKSIAKNSLPQFVRSMNASLAKELPGEIEEFYPVAAECIRSCLNSIRGPGRYLQAVFPEEMKAVRSGIDVIGRGINTITASLGRYRQEKDRIDAARSLQGALLDISADIRSAQEKDHRITDRLTEIKERIAAIDRELKVLSDDSGMHEIRDREQGVKEAEERLEAATRTNAALSMTASHVFRKAEKIAARQKHPAEIGALRHAMELLSDHTAPETGDLSPALALACPIAERMIAEQEIVLKNREERAIFSDTEKFCAAICTSYAEMTAAEDLLRKAQENLASHPLLVRIHSLEREMTQLRSMQKKEETAQSELAGWIQKTREKIPELKEELIKKIEEMKGGSVQLQADDPILA